MFLTIRTRYVPVIGTGRGSRWIARGGGHQVTMPTDYEAGPWGSSDAAADTLARAHGAVPLVCVSRVQSSDSGAYVYTDMATAAALRDIDDAQSVDDALRESGARGGADDVRRVYVAIATGRTPGRLLHLDRTGLRIRFAEAWHASHAGDQGNQAVSS